MSDDEKLPVGLILDPGEKGRVGTMMVENLGEAPIELAVHGDGPVLREKMMVTPETATTPALRVYHAVQSMYLDPEGATTALPKFLELARELVGEVPSTGAIMADIGEFLIAGDYHQAFEQCFQLMQYEAFLEEKAAEAAAKAAEQD